MRHKSIGLVVAALVGLPLVTCGDSSGPGGGNGGDGVDGGDGGDGGNGGGGGTPARIVVAGGNSLR
jgi:hypothetical protein